MCQRQEIRFKLWMSDCKESYVLEWRWAQCVSLETRGHQVGFWQSMWRSRYHSAWHWSERWKHPRVPGFPATGYDQQTDHHGEEKHWRRSGKTGEKERQKHPFNINHFSWRNISLSKTVGSYWRSTEGRINILYCRFLPSVWKNTWNCANNEFVYSE